MKKIVHVSGFNLRENPLVPSLDREGNLQQVTTGDAEVVLWGDPDKRKLGRITTALSLARDIDADHLVWSTGCSRRQSDLKWEAEVHYEMARDRYYDLHGQFPHRFSRVTWRTEQAYHAWLARKSSFDTSSRNTMESMMVLEQLVRDSMTRRPERAIIYLVSSANHAPRVLRDACQAFGIGASDASFTQRIRLVAVPAETNYGGKYVQDVVVRDLGN